MTDPDTIAKRAYELFLARGSEPGREMDDWLQAEAELNASAAPHEVQARDDHPAPETGEESEPAIDRDRRASGKRTGGTRRTARQPHTH